MAKRRASQAPVGLTSNGVLLVNVLGLLDAQQAGKVRASLPARLGSDWFVGVALRGAENDRVFTRLDDAAAEVAAAIAGQRKASAKPSAKRRAKARSSAAKGSKRSR